MDVEELTPQLPELSHRQRPAIDPAGVAPVPMDLPLEHQLLPVLGKAVVLQPLQGQRAGEHRVDQRRFGTGADQLPAGPLPQDGADGVDDDGFTRPRLAGQDVKAPVKADVRRLDNGDVFDVKQ